MKNGEVTKRGEPGLTEVSVGGTPPRGRIRLVPAECSSFSGRLKSKVYARQMTARRIVFSK